jgi:hypothetical protein
MNLATRLILAFIIVVPILRVCAFAGDTPAAPMTAPSGSMVVPVQAQDAPAVAEAPIVAHDARIVAGECIYINGSPLACTPGSLSAQIAGVNHDARAAADADPLPTPCRAHVLAVERLAAVHGWTTEMVVSSKGFPTRHASALVHAGARDFLLDNGSLIDSAAAWMEVSGVDYRASWQVEAVR